MNAELVFWVIHLPMMVLFLLGMWLVFANWLKGSVSGQAGANTGGKLWGVVKNSVTTIFSRRLWLLIKGFFVEAWFNRRLFRTDRRRWISHFALLSGFLLLMVLSGFSAVADKLLIHFWPHLEEVTWIGMWANQDHPVTAVLNEIGAVLMTAGLLYFLIRRSRGQASQLRNGPLDRWMLLGLIAILTTGWITTIVRLNSSHVHPPIYFSFISYPLSLLVGWIPLPWDTLYGVMYVLHGVLTSVVIVYIPFSKFMHVIAGALVTIINQMHDDAARLGWDKGGVHGRA
jgi:nitrate reductase gamma subunit